jgi:integrase
MALRTQLERSGERASRPPGARPRQRAVRRSLCAGRRGAGSARRRRSATLGPRTQRAAGGDPVALPLRRDPAPRTHSHHRASPTKRHDRAIVSYLDEQETGALLAASDERRWIGRRDHALMTFTIQTGLRVSELIALRWQGAHLAGAPHIQATGKRRKQRITPLTTHTTDVLRCWTKERAGGPEQPLFPTSRGRRSAATPSPYWSANTRRPRPAAARRWPPRRSHRTCCATPPRPFGDVIPSAPTRAWNAARASCASGSVSSGGTARPRRRPRPHRTSSAGSERDRALAARCRPPA